MRKKTAAIIGFVFCAAVALTGCATSPVKEISVPESGAGTTGETVLEKVRQNQ